MRKFFLAAAGFALCFGLPSPILISGMLPASSQQESYDRPREATRTFTGTIARHGSTYVLAGKTEKTDYRLDDPKRASEFEGKKVKVTGTLNAENLTIHVQTIEEIS